VIRRMTKETQQKVNTMRAAEAKIDNLRKQIAIYDSVATPLIAAMNDGSVWVQLLEELNARLPKEDIWITELVPISGGKQGSAATPSEPSIDGILIRGLYLFNPKQQEVVVDYFRSLATSPFFNVDPKNQARHIKPATPNNTEWAFPYELRLDLKKPIKMP
jgi:Tfp pilus assembly protein PilN